MSLESLSSASPIALALVALLSLFSVLGFLDGVWIHLVREKLHTRPESRTEHLLHTARAVVFVPTLLTVFADAQGTALWIGIALLGVDEALGLADGVVEKKSRRNLGGLTTGEYLVHVGVTGVHWAAIALALVLRFQGREGPFMRSFSQFMAPGAVVLALVHVALALRKPSATMTAHRRRVVKMPDRPLEEGAAYEDHAEPHFSTRSRAAAPRASRCRTASSDVGHGDHPARRA